jgi:ribosomal protein L22
MSPEDKDELETPASEDTSTAEAVAPAEPLEVPKEPESASEDAAAAEVPSEPPAPVETDTPEAAAEDDVEAAAEDEVEAAAEDDVEAAAEDEDEAAAEDEDEAPADETPATRSRRLRRPRRGADKAAAPADKPARPTPARRKAKRDPNLPLPVVRAQAKYVRSSARKARLVCDNIRGKSVEEARAILTLTPRAIARDWSKLLESAVANAEHNHELVGEDLYVKAVHADEGPTIKRFQPRAMGRATKIRKRTSHLTILLTPKD